MDQDLWAMFISKQYSQTLDRCGKHMREHHLLDHMHVAGLCLVSLGKTTEGVDFLAASLSLSEAPAAWFANAATACMEQQQYAFAIMFLTNGLKEHPDDLKMTYMQGLCHVHIHDWSKAIEFMQQAKEISEDFYHADLATGFCYHMLGVYDKALEYYDRITRATAEDMETRYNNQACVYMELGQQQKALDYLLEKCPGTERAATLYNMAFLYLGLGEWDLGWKLYRYRDTVMNTPYSGGHGSGVTSVPKVAQPLARSLHDISGKHLLLFHEQGYGDTLQFVRYARMLEPIANGLTIGVPPTLVRLLQHMDLVFPFKVTSDTDGTTDCEVAVPMLDSPSLFETTPDTIPNFGPYFTVPDELVEQHKIANAMSNRLKVGLVWAGASRVDNIRAHSIDRRRSIPFDLVKPLLELTVDHSIDFYSLQLSDHHRDHPYLSKVLNDDFDMLDTASVIEQLDLVITIDSSLAHLSAALGKPTWMLSRFDGCWRWGWQGETTTAWYDTMRIYRQPAHNTWDRVVADVIRDLKAVRPLHSTENLLGAV